MVLCRYEVTQKDVTKWQSIVKANREAPTLKFASGNEDVPRTSTTSALTAKFAPSQDYEKEIAAMLEAAGAHNEKAVQESEEALALKVGRTRLMPARQIALEQIYPALRKDCTEAPQLCTGPAFAYMRYTLRVIGSTAPLSSRCSWLQKHGSRLSHESGYWAESLLLLHRDQAVMALKACVVLQCSPVIHRGAKDAMVSGSGTCSDDGPLKKQCPLGAGVGRGGGEEEDVVLRGA